MSLNSTQPVPDTMRCATLGAAGTEATAPDNPTHPVICTVSDGIALVTLNRPAKLNALNYALIDHLQRILHWIELEPTVGASVLTGETFTPAQALEMGLINQVVAPDQLLPYALGLATEILSHSPLAIAGILHAVTRGLNMTIGEGLLVESEQFARLVPSKDLREGLDAWLARRMPVFCGT